ncbi:MAG: hypothetical protein ACLP62_13985 [Acidimicrobiales bacterium]
MTHLPPPDEHEDEEGWFTDPYALHEARWLSAGRPTKLVRDGDVESYDDPPDGAFVAEPRRIEEAPTAANGSDLLRTGEESSQYDEGEALMESLDAIGQVGAPNTKRLLDGEGY